MCERTCGGWLLKLWPYYDCIVLYIMVAYPAAVARTRSLQVKELKVVRVVGPA
jgi:hypothetical protein